MEKFQEMINKFKTLFMENCVYCKIRDKYGYVEPTFPQELDDILSFSMDEFNNSSEIAMGTSFCSVDGAMKRIDKGLSKAGKNPEKYLPKVWQGSLEEELLTTAFWALAFRDETIMHRAKVAYYLDSQKVELGLSGYSTKLNKFISCYFTEFDNYVFYINPIKGEVYRSKEKVYDGALVLNNKKLYKGHTLIAEEKEDGMITFHIGMEIKARDNKKSEKEKAQKEGKKIKDTCWLTTDLGHMFGHNCYIRTHTFICLMVYGCEPVKFATMEGNSILSIDHTIPIHNLNTIDNLALCPRSSNSSKKGKNEEIFDYT